eukprot:m.44974 g.44974  ORF g.44974 m.44974 type:complete len:159 (-) comp14614_c0_seq2:36-512(-)
MATAAAAAAPVQLMIIAPELGLLPMRIFTLVTTGSRVPAVLLLESLPWQFVPEASAALRRTREQLEHNREGLLSSEQALEVCAAVQRSVVTTSCDVCHMRLKILSGLAVGFGAAAVTADLVSQWLCPALEEAAAVLAESARVFTFCTVAEMFVQRALR